MIQGNFIGTDPSGTSARANQGVGVYVIDSADNTIGGTAPADRNLISGNSLAGIALANVGSTKNLVLGNFIGTDHNGTLPLGNNQGILISVVTGNTGPSSSQNTIANNVISGNRTDGIQIFAPNGGGSGNLIQGNFIGTNASGDNLGNVDDGVLIADAPNNTVGAANTIGHNGTGIDITGSGATGNVVLGNYIGTDAGGAKLGNGYGVVIDTARRRTRSAGREPARAT